MKLSSCLLVFALSACAPSSHGAQAAASETRASVTTGRAAPLPEAMTCTGGTGDGARVELDTRRWVATYHEDGRLIGSSVCGGTRIRGYDMVCTQDSRFRVMLAVVFGGQSGTLDAGGRTIQLTCR